jgi:hypothetical protein
MIPVAGRQYKTESLVAGNRLSNRIRTPEEDSNLWKGKKQCSQYIGELQAE